MDDCSSSYSRPPELNWRFSIPLQSSSDRMESGPLIFSSHSSVLSSAIGRCICHSPECTTPGIWVSNARQLGSSPGCHVTGLELMVLDLPVSSSESSLTEPPKTQAFNSDSSRMEKLTLVLSSFISLQKILFSQSHSISVGKNFSFFSIFNI